MKDIDFKGTVYDFFGYLIPGLLLILFSLNAYEHSNLLFDHSLIKGIINNKLATTTYLIIVIVCYCLGHLISALSSLLIEKGIVCNLPILNRNLTIESLLSKGSKSAFYNKFKEIFKCDYSDKDFRLVINYVESRENQIYNTAFTYLSFYGMSRSIAFVFNIIFTWEIWNALAFRNNNLLLYVFCYLFLAFIFYYNYFRFFKYFKIQIFNGFILNRYKD